MDGRDGVSTQVGEDGVELHGATVACLQNLPGRSRNMLAMTATRYRVLFLSLGVAFALVVVFAVVLAPGGTETAIPPAVESIAPANNETVQRQTALTVDMQVGYDIDLYIDGVKIPADEVAHTQATGKFVWTPGPATTFSEWSPGLHSVQVSYVRVSGRADAGEVRWTFRVQ